jgi:hypothetical protein
MSVTAAPAKSRRLATLLETDVLSPVSPAAGFPLWMPYGTQLAERFCDLYRELLAEQIDLVECECPPLLDAQVYEDIFSVSYDYANMFELDDAGRRRIVRPDNLLGVAMALKDTPVHVPVVVQGALYRSEMGDVAPLVRDRQMWCTLQTVHWAGSTAADRSAPVDLHRTVCEALHRRLAIPAIFVNTPGIRTYSSSGCHSFAIWRDGRATLTSTLFVLGDALVARLGLDGTVIDFGFTAKLLALSLDIHSDDAGLCLPSSVAPTVVAIGCRSANDADAANRLAAQIGAVAVRVSVDHGPWHRTLRVQRRRGTPLLILVDGTSGTKLIRRVSMTSMPLSSDPSADIRQALTEHDAILTARALERFEASVRAGDSLRFRDGPEEEGWHALGQVRSATSQAVASGLTMFARKGRLY